MFFGRTLASRERRKEVCEFGVLFLEMLVLGNKELEEQRLLGNKDPEEKRLLCCRVVPGSVVYLQQVGSTILVQHEAEA